MCPISVHICFNWKEYHSVVLFYHIPLFEKTRHCAWKYVFMKKGLKLVCEVNLKFIILCWRWWNYIFEKHLYISFLTYIYVFLFIESCTNPFSRLWNITNNFNTLNKQRWNDSIQSVISDYQVFFIIATLEFPLLRKALLLVGSPIVIFIVVFLREGLTLVF